MTPERLNSSLAIFAGGIFAAVILASGVLFPKHTGGGITQMGRHISVAFEDGSTMEMSESETDLAVWKRRRFAGGVGHDFQQIFIMADGREMEVPYSQSSPAEDSDGLDTGDHLILAANTLDTGDKPALDKPRSMDETLGLRLDGSYQVAADKSDAGNGIAVDVIDGKDRVIAVDPKDGVTQQPVFAVSTEQSEDNDRQAMLFMSAGGYFGSASTLMGGMALGPGGSTVGTGSGVALPPIGAAVPEPSALALIGVAGVAGWAITARRRRQMAA